MSREEAELRAEIALLHALLLEMAADEPDTPIGVYLADIEAALKRKP